MISTLLIALLAASGGILVGYVLGVRHSAYIIRRTQDDADDDPFLYGDRWYSRREIAELVRRAEGR